MWLMLLVKVFLLNYGKKRDKLDIHAVEVLKNYLLHNQPIKAELQGTVVAI